METVFRVYIFSVFFCGFVSSYTGPDIAVSQSIHDVLLQAELEAHEDLKREERMATGTPSEFYSMHDTSTFMRMHRFKRASPYLIRDDSARINEKAQELMVKKYENRYSRRDVLEAMRRTHPLQRNTRGLSCKYQNVNCKSWFHLDFRSLDGTCNNIFDTLWGSTGVPYRRLMEPDYADGIGKKLRGSSSGGELPTPRLVSTTIGTPGADRKMPTTLLYMTFSQFMNHDLDHTVGSNILKKNGFFQCGKTDCNVKGPCSPILVPSKDPFFKKKKCIPFTRSEASTDLLCTAGGPRQQISDITAYVDGSNVYGSSKQKSDKLRDPKDRAKLKTRSAGSLKPFLPPDDDVACKKDVFECGNFFCGDVRCPEQIGLSTMHTMWMREHNRLVDKLRNVNPSWKNDQLFFTARKIVGACMQHISYNEYLPMLFGGTKVLNNLGLGLAPHGEFYTGYNPHTEGTVSNVFVVCANRYGHSCIPTKVPLMDGNFKIINNLNIADTFFRGDILFDKHTGGVDAIARGMASGISDPSDRFFTDQITNHLFAIDSHHPGDDLLSINIQRGRDHGIPSYNKWRVMCGFQPAHDFDDLGKILRNAGLAKKLQSIYKSVDDIDAYIGGLSEPVIGEGNLGETFQCLLAEEFKNIRDGDRFWYENPGIQGFTMEQLTEIRKSSLARVFCDNGDKITKLQRDLFMVPDNGQNRRVSCSQITGMDISKFKGPVKDLSF